tara:strand:- start:4173 stop:4790 length:618 start_codon:yes stop_codon:yes gene_type:complete
MLRRERISSVFHQTMFTENYQVSFTRSNKTIKLAVTAQDVAHAQAQALDITRSLEADKFELGYGACKNSQLSDLYKKLAYNDFSHDHCYEWESSLTNGVPSVYAFGRRYYVRPLILGYLDIQKDQIVKNTCGNTKCINPYHNHYMHFKNSKLGGGDMQIALAFRSQGVSVPQIAKVLKVHRSTIYRALKNERLLIGDKGHRQGDP